MLGRSIPIMLTRIFSSAALVLVVASCSAGQQESPVPNEVRRRIAQAVWPENLFDSSGQPDRGFVRRPFRPEFADLHIRRAGAIDGLSGATLFVGTAVPSACIHCAEPTYAVAQRGSEFVSLLGPEDIAYLAPWAGKDVLGDSVRLRSFVISALRETCFLGCEVKQILERSEVPHPDSLFLRPIGEDRGPWRVPRTYSWQQDGGVVLEFAIFSRRFGVYRAWAEWDGLESLQLSVAPVAHFMLP